MFWRFGEGGAGDGEHTRADEPRFLYHEVRHCLRYGGGPWVRLSHHPALILSLLLRMHALGRAATADEIRAFLDLPKGARINGHLSELRKKLAQTGADPGRVLEPDIGKKVYRLSPGVHATMLVEADAIRSLDEILAGKEPLSPTLLEKLRGVREQLLLVSVPLVAVLGLTTWLTLRPDRGAEPHAQVEEEGELRTVTASTKLFPDRVARTFIASSNAGQIAHSSGAYSIDLEPGAAACFDLASDLRLSERAAIELDLVSDAPRQVDLVLYPARSGASPAVVPHELRAGPEGNRIQALARDLDPKLRDGVRRMCLALPSTAAKKARLTLRRVELTEAPEP